jgi:hypothetical protein
MVSFMQKLPMKMKMFLRKDILDLLSMQELRKKKYLMSLLKACKKLL